jgi:hypothetical protein
LKAYKRQIEEAEEIAAINLAKFRKAQDDIISASSSNTSEVYQVFIIFKLFLIIINFGFDDFNLLESSCC